MLGSSVFKLQAVVHDRTCDVTSDPICPHSRRYQMRPEAYVESAFDSNGACRSPHDHVSMPKADPSDVD